MSMVGSLQLFAQGMTDAARAHSYGPGTESGQRSHIMRRRVAHEQLRNDQLIGVCEFANSSHNSAQVFSGNERVCGGRRAKVRLKMAEIIGPQIASNENLPPTP